jgi:hypothetical protein
MDPETRRRWDDAEAVAVFGVGFKRDASGRPIEQGRGAPGNETPESVAALNLAGLRKDDLKVKAGI